MDDRRVMKVMLDANSSQYRKRRVASMIVVRILFLHSNVLATATRNVKGARSEEKKKWREEGGKGGRGKKRKNEEGKKETEEEVKRRRRIQSKWREDEKQ